MKITHTMIRVVLFMFILCAPIIALAQPGFGDDVNDSGAPLDGGLSLLAVAGAGYGLKKIREARKKNNGAENSAGEDTVQK